MSAPLVSWIALIVFALPVLEAARRPAMVDRPMRILACWFAFLTVENAVSNFYNLLNLPLGIEDDGLLAIAERRAARAN